MKIRPILFTLLVIPTTTTIVASNFTKIDDDEVIVKNNLLIYEDVDPRNPIFIFMCIVYILSTLSAIISNLIVILVYKFGYRTTTDLSLFLVNLAVADFLMSTVCMPFTFAQALLKKWIFGDIMCPIVLFKQVLAVSLSIYTLVAIGIDRYIAIKSPLKNRVTNKKSKFVILLVWIISLSLASVQLFVARAETVTFIVFRPKNTTIVNAETGVAMTANSYYTTSPVENVSDYRNLTNFNVEKIFTHQCNENWNNESTRQAYTLFSFFAVYLIPVFMLAYTYTCIACIIKATTHPGNADLCRDMHYNKSKKKVIKMLIVLVCAFTLCWGPLHMFTLMQDFTKWLALLPNDLWIYYAVHWLAMANCTINPFIYGYSSKKFRSDVYSLVCCCYCFTSKFRRTESNPSHHTNSLFCKKLPRSHIHFSSRKYQQQQQQQLQLQQQNGLKRNTSASSAGVGMPLVDTTRNKGAGNNGRMNNNNEQNMRLLNNSSSNKNNFYNLYNSDDAIASNTRNGKTNHKNRIS